jgi:hypothetical protein
VKRPKAEPAPAVPRCTYCGEPATEQDYRGCPACQRLTRRERVELYVARLRVMAGPTRGE